MLPQVLLAAALVFDGSLRSEVRGGTAVAGQDPSSAGVSAQLRTQATAPEGTLTILLTPSLTLAQGTQAFARGTAECALRAGPGWVRLRQGFGYGSVDLSPLS